MKVVAEVSAEKVAKVAKDVKAVKVVAVVVVAVKVCEENSFRHLNCTHSFSRSWPWTTWSTSKRRQRQTMGTRNQIRSISE